MSVTLTVERKVIPGEQGEIKQLLRELRSKATPQLGFISGQTVVDAFNPTKLMTISHWSTIAAWENWEKNPERIEIIDLKGVLLQEMPKERLWLYDEDAPPGAV